MPVLSPEDLLITKILAGRPKDLEDVRSVLQERGGELDLSYVRNVLAELQEALHPSDLLPQLEEELRRSKPG